MDTKTYAKTQFANACKEKIGLLPLQDDDLVLKAAVAFNQYIKLFKKLDHSITWHRGLIDSLVFNKLNTLSNRIIKNYGTHKEYINRVRRRHGFS